MIFIKEVNKKSLKFRGNKWCEALRKFLKGRKPLIVVVILPHYASLVAVSALAPSTLL